MLYPKYLGSSVDQTKLSTTLKGVAGLIVVAAVYFGFDIDQASLETGAEVLAVALSAATAAYSAAIAAYGAIRKIKVSRIK